MKRILLLAALLLSVPLLCPAQDQLLPNNSLPFVAALPATCTPGITASVELSVSPFSINYCSAINTWSALTASSGSTWSSLPGGTNTSSGFVCGTGCSLGTTGSGTITATNGLNSVVNDTNVTGSVSGGALTLAWSGTAAKNRLPATTVYTDQNNTFTLLQDFSGATLRLPTGAGFTSSAGSVLGIDTSNKNPHIFINAQDSYLWTAPVSGVYNNNDCAKFLLSSGQITLVDAGSNCNGLPLGPTSPNGVVSNLTSTPSSGIAGPAIWTLPGLIERNVTGVTNSDTIRATDCNPMPIFYQGSVAVSVTLPTASTLGVAGCTLRLTNNTSGSATVVTVTPTTWAIVPNVAGNLPIQQGQSCLLTVDATVATQWDALCADEPMVAGSGITITRGQFGSTIASTSTGISGLTTGFFPKAASPTTLTNSLCDEGITTASTVTCSDTAGLAAKFFTATGTTAGFFAAGQGSANGHATANTITLEAPAAVTSYELVLPGTATTGLSLWTNASNVETITLLTSAAAGDLIVGTGTTWQKFAGNNSGTLCFQENGSGVAAWGACGGSSALSAITAATTTNTIANGNNGGQVWNWALTTAQTAFTLGETTGATTAGAGILAINTAATSNAVPLTVTQGTGVSATAAPNAFTLTGGVGGANGGATNPGQKGGGVSLTTGAGSNAGATSGTGGAGGDFAFVTGAGGTAAAGSTTGKGGDFSVTLGAAGATGTLGAPGQFKLVGNTVGGANTTPFLNITGTWNTTGVVDAAIFANITNTASGAASKLIDLQIGSTSVFNVDKAANLTLAGATAGYLQLGQGSTNATGTTAIVLQAPAAVTSYVLTMPGAAANGIPINVNAANVITQSFSGDAAHSINQTGKVAAITTATLCAATAGTACGQVGEYRVHWEFWGSGTACSAVTAGSVGLNLTWTDENAVAHTTIAMPMWDQKSAALGTAFNFNTALGTEGASGDYTISTNGTIIQYATTYTACTTGTGTYNLRATVEQLQ